MFSQSESFVLYFGSVADVGSLVWAANPFVPSAPVSELRVQECRSAIVSEVGGTAGP